MLAFLVAVLSLLILTGSGVCHQVPSSVIVTHTGSALSLPPPSTARSNPSSHDRYTGYEVTGKQESHARDEHIDDIRRRTTKLASVQHITPDWAGIQTLETRAATMPYSSPDNTKSLTSPSQDGNGESGISGSASVSASAPIANRVHDLKRSKGIFLIIKAVLVSWAIMLVGMLTYMVARYAEEMLFEEPSLDTEPTEDHERAALLDHENV
ncbi:hypothetical protein F5883DRAFT_518405 [Diaporthe sp. PMI_573]|nr:hypothetical protein F5883DRAFT_518405 [Diaporthaceae sp. PMI_573]